MKRKIIALMLMVSMTATLSACGGTENTTDSGTAVAETVTESIVAITETPVAETTTEPAETAETLTAEETQLVDVAPEEYPELAALNIRVAYVADYYTGEEGEKLIQIKNNSDTIYYIDGFPYSSDIFHPGEEKLGYLTPEALKEMTVTDTEPDFIVECETIVCATTYPEGETDDEGRPLLNVVKEALFYGEGPAYFSDNDSFVIIYDDSGKVLSVTRNVDYPYVNGEMYANGYVVLDDLPEGWAVMEMHGENSVFE